MEWLRPIGLAVLSLTIAPTREAQPWEEPIPVVDLKLPEPRGPEWVKMSAHSAALRVRLNGLGARTHANWVLFRLPFDADQKDRIRRVKYTISAKSKTEVGALMIGSVCTRFPTSGGAGSWTSYTSSGIARTMHFDWHPHPPSDDPTILGLNVPTRVANYVACGWDEGHLTDPEDWSIDISWEQR